MIENFKEIVQDWGLKGFGVGLAVGFILEVFLVRNNKGHVSFITTFMSIFAMGLMGWLSYDIALDAFSDSAWKPSVWTVGITANTWWFSRFAVSGQMFRLVSEFIIPEKVKKAMRRDEDERGTKV